MGCCISSENKNPHSPNALSKPPLAPESDKTHLNNRGPPPCLEEETVKEVVLSETRLTKENNKAQMSIIQEHSLEAKDIINKHEEETSQVSEIYSISESFSTTTTATTATTVALTEKKEDEAISKMTAREMNHRSPAKVTRRQPNAGDITRGAKSPAKRAETSPVMSRSVPGKTMPRNVGYTIGARRENANGSSVRRSRSPATRTTGGMGRSRPGKVPGRPGGRLRVENSGEEEEVNDGDLNEKSALNESLDNPHVSLECFIFL